MSNATITAIKMRSEAASVAPLHLARLQSLGFIDEGLGDFFLGIRASGVPCRTSPTQRKDISMSEPPEAGGLQRIPHLEEEPMFRR